MPRDGLTAYKEGRYGDALAAFRAAAADEPDSAVATANVGAALARLGRHDDAARAFTEALEKKPDRRVEAAVRFGLGTELMALGQVAEAVESFKQSLRLNPDDVEAKENLEIALRRLPRTPPPQGGGDDSSGGASPPSGQGGAGQQDQQRGRPGGFDRDEAERLLDAIGRRERLEFPRRARRAPADPNTPDW